MSDQSDIEDDGSDISFGDENRSSSDSPLSESETSADSEVDENTRNILRGPWLMVNDPELYERPSEINEFQAHSGPINPPPRNSLPIEYFNRLASDPAMGESIVNILVTETNRYAAQYLQNTETQISWTNTFPDEMNAFLGLYLSMGLVKKPSLRSYWMTSADSWLTSTPSFRSVMSRNRFQNILRFLHCNNNDEQIPRGEENHDHAFKIRPVLDLVNNTFKDNYDLARDVTVDESVVGFKGRHHLVQYMPGKKTHRWGPKWHILAEGDTGYVSTLSLYCGKGGVRSEHGSGFDIVTGLVNPLRDQWHHVLVDNFFCSPYLCHFLMENQTYVTGTVRVHRKGMPASFKRIRVPKGQREVRQQGDLMAMKYGDRKQVTFLSTFSSPRNVNIVNAKGQQKTIPTVVNLYNKKMGGVDLGDQHIQSYDPAFRSLKMWKKLLFNIILRIVANSYIIYKSVNRLNPRKLSKQQFWTSVCQGLVGEFRNQNSERGRPSMLAAPLRMAGKHFPSRFEGKKRKRCTVCKKRTRINCSTCSVGLCLGACFNRFHTVRHYWR